MLNAKLGRSKHDFLHVFNPNLAILSQLIVPNWPNTNNDDFGDKGKLKNLIILVIPICERAIKSVVA